MSHSGDFESDYISFLVKIAVCLFERSPKIHIFEYFILISISFFLKLLEILRIGEYFEDKFKL